LSFEDDQEEEIVVKKSNFKLKKRNFLQTKDEGSPSPKQDVPNKIQKTESDP